MPYIRYKYNNYPVSYEVKNLVSKYDIESYAVAIIENKNFLEGKIPYELFLTALRQYYYKASWLQLFESEVYGKNLIPHDIAQEFIRLSPPIEWSIIDEKYNKGIIKDEHFKLILEIVRKKYVYFNTKGEIIRIILAFLTSKGYEEGSISDEHLKLILPTENYFQPEDNDENKGIDESEIAKKLELIYRIIIHVIYYIITSENIKTEDKEEYIYAILNMESKEELCNIYHTCSENKQFGNMDDFARNVFLYILPTLRSHSRKGQSRKKIPNNSQG